MKYSLFDSSKSEEVVDLFTKVFSESEGEKEGLVLGDFVSKLVSYTDPQDLVGCVVEEGANIVGCVFFSRFTVPSGQVAFILSPLAISTACQRKGIGQKLIGYGLDHLKSENVSLVFTYGDPSYYSKTGFQQISESVVKAPLPLSEPIGWLGPVNTNLTTPVFPEKS